jgi:hypothetical protein
MLDRVDKTALVRALWEALAERQRTNEVAAKAAAEAATHEEAKPENDKDTRALEASYLAGAQASRARELEVVMNAIKFMPLKKFGPTDTIDASALVELSTKAIYFIAPHGGGMKATVNGVAVTVITPDAPLGRALIGQGQDDEIDFNGRKLTIKAIR